MTPREYYEARAKSIIKDLREEKHLSYLELSAELRKVGVRLSEQSLITRINRGRFTFVFALQVLAALGVKSVDVPPPPKAPAKPGK